MDKEIKASVTHVLLRISLEILRPDLEVIWGWWTVNFSRKHKKIYSVVGKCTELEYQHHFHCINLFSLERRKTGRDLIQTCDLMEENVEAEERGKTWKFRIPAKKNEWKSVLGFVSSLWPGAIGCQCNRRANVRGRFQTPTVSGLGEIMRRQSGLGQSISSPLELSPLYICSKRRRSNWFILRGWLNRVDDWLFDPSVRRNGALDHEVWQKSLLSLIPGSVNEKDPVLHIQPSHWCKKLDNLADWRKFLKIELI